MAGKGCIDVKGIKICLSDIIAMSKKLWTFYEKGIPKFNVTTDYAMAMPCVQDKNGACMALTPGSSSLGMFENWKTKTVSGFSAQIKSGWPHYKQLSFNFDIQMTYGGSLAVEGTSHGQYLSKAQILIHKLDAAWGNKVTMTCHVLETFNAGSIEDPIAAIHFQVQATVDNAVFSTKYWSCDIIVKGDGETAIDSCSAHTGPDVPHCVSDHDCSWDWAAAGCKCSNSTLCPGGKHKGVNDPVNKFCKLKSAKCKCDWSAPPAPPVQTIAYHCDSATKGCAQVSRAPNVKNNDFGTMNACLMTCSPGDINDRFSWSCANDVCYQINNLDSGTVGPYKTREMCQNDCSSGDYNPSVDSKGVRKWYSDLSKMGKIVMWVGIGSVALLMTLLVTALVVHLIRHHRKKTPSWS